MLAFPFGVLSPHSIKAQSSGSKPGVGGNAQGEKPGNKKAKLPPENLGAVMLANAQYNFSFSKSGLKNVSLGNPTSLQFGPDGRLYVSQQNGIIKAFTIVRAGPGDYTVSATETIDLINTIPNHNDDGSLNTQVTTRQVTGILVVGTATSPILYVSSSDSRIGGPDGDFNLDTNSGIVSRLTRTGSTWSKMDLVRGLPRSEENHSVNGMQLDATKNTLYLAVGGFTNAGGPSTNFAYINEYALSAAILSINLTAIDALPTKGSGTTTYKYDLPTVNDPTRTNNPDGTDVNDPFGGNDGLNQAKIVAGGPVQVYSAGYRNPYDLVITKTPGKARRMYTIDNGANQGWGGYPDKEGSPDVTNKYLTNEPGSTVPSTNEGVVNNLDNLEYIGNLDTYIPGSHYGGHPNPIRANPAGAGLYVHNGTSGTWRSSKTGTTPLPQDWPPVPQAHPIEGDFQMPGVGDTSPLTFTNSTNGLAEYTASNFSNALKGTLLACSYDGSIYKITLTEDGTGVTNPKAAADKVNQDLPFASNFGSIPLDVTTQGDTDIFPGTVWAATYGSNTITVFEPQDFLVCTGLYNSADDDNDGYTNADEIDNGSQPCSAASVPTDTDKDLISDLNDPDDDNDGLADNVDHFGIDANNGLSTSMPVRYELLNNYPGTGFYGVGFTGLMVSGTNDYFDLYEDKNLIPGGTAGAFTVVNVSAGDALGALNNQENAFQFGVKAGVATGPFTIKSRLLGPFFNGQTPVNNQSQGIYIGNGDQDNYLKIALVANGGLGGIQLVYEKAGSVVLNTTYALPAGIPSSTLDLVLAVNPSTGTVQPKYSANGGSLVNLGSPITLSGALLTILQSNQALAVGLIATSRGATPFTATWDFIYVTADEALTAVYRLNAGADALMTSLGSFTADQYFTPTPGNSYASSATIAGTNDAALYQTERYGTAGSFSYALPVANGSYRVVLHFAELYWTAAGQRVFDVSLEGARVLDNYDIVKKVGAFTATTETFTTTVADGTLNLLFSGTAADGGVDQPKVSAIEVYSNTPSVNRPPVVATPIPDQVATINTAFSYAVPVSTFADADLDPLTYTATLSTGLALPSWLTFTASTRTFSGTPPAGSPASLTLRVSASDGKGGSALDDFLLTITAATLAPVYRINAGGDQLPTSLGTFAADYYYSAATSYVYTTTSPIAGTTDDALYQTERSSSTNQGSFTYALPVPNGTYRVVLHFAETWWTAANQRVFDVSLEGARVLDNYDIVKKVGAFTATTETFTTTVADGTLNLLFSGLAGDGGIDRPKVSAIEVFSTTAVGNRAPLVATSIPNQGATTGTAFTYTFPAATFWDADLDPLTYTATLSTGLALPSWLTFTASTRTFSGTPPAGSPASLTLRVSASDGKGGSAPDDFLLAIAGSNWTPLLRVNAGGSQLTTSMGSFAADQYYTAANSYVYTTTSPIAGTTDDALYQTERSSNVNQGSFTYSMPVANGTYRVVLHFAELYWSGTGKRIFDVSLEGTQVLDNYDIVKKVGAFTATTETFTTSVADGALTLYFSALANDGGIDRPKVSAIEVYSTAPASARTSSVATSMLHTDETVTKAEGATSVTVYPTPTRDGRLHLRLPATGPGFRSYQLYSALGQQLATGLLPAAAGDTVPLDLSSYLREPGVYMLRLIGPGANLPLKLVKE
ncbi:malectin domain-containing carbohydrate-binding protein [Hymenobacter wooponensis]|nr:malectin domain-containing carbohydrate-binding protein [Hymenobacter wooponensis]